MKPDSAVCLTSHEDDRLRECAHETTLPPAIREAATVLRLSHRGWSRTQIAEFIHWDESEVGNVLQRWQNAGLASLGLSLDYSALASRSQVPFAPPLREKSLTGQELLLDEIEHLSHIGTWELNCQTGAWACTDETFRIHGLIPTAFNRMVIVDPGSETLPLEIFLPFYSPETREVLRQALLNLRYQGQAYDLELTLLTAEGQQRWIRATGKPIFANHQMVKVMGHLMDITERKQIELQLQQSEDFLRGIYEGSQNSLFIVDVSPQGEFYYFGLNEAYSCLTGLSTQDIQGKTPEQVLPQITSALARRQYQNCVDVGRTITYEEYIPFQGKEFWWITRLTPIQDQTGRIYRLVGSSLNITELKQTSQALQESELLFRSLFEQSAIGICFCTPEGYIFEANDAFRAITGYSQTELRTIRHRDLLYSDDVSDALTVFRHLIEGTIPNFSIELRYCCKGGRVIWVNLTASILRDEAGQAQVLQTLIKDISDRKQSEDYLRFIALHDALTQLPNRTALMERLELNLLRARHEPDYAFAVLFLDLDRFKVINDGLGHNLGNVILTQVAQRLHIAIAPMGLAAYLGGDEFVLLLDTTATQVDAVEAAEVILAMLEQPIYADQREVTITASIGVVLVTSDYEQAVDIIRDADIAMYRAKAQGKNCYAVFDTSMHRAALRRMQLESDLRGALERNEFTLVYQPIVNLATRMIQGVEALLRWHHPQRGLINPTVFVPIAEETGLINAIGRWVVQQVCTQLHHWESAAILPDSFFVSLNLAANQLQDPKLMPHLDRCLEQTRTPGRRLVFEITENSLLTINETIQQLIQQLRDRSIRLAIDDFGTGYSSLAYLNQLPFDALKIDQSFIAHLGQSKDSQKITQTILTLAEQLDLIAIAEGIETLEQLQHLQQWHCCYGQGYLFSPPLTVDQIGNLLTADTHLTPRIVVDLY